MRKRYKTDGIGKVLVSRAMLIGALASAAIAADPLPVATASSEWSAECTAARAADRIAGENNNYLLDVWSDPGCRNERCWVSRLNISASAWPRRH